MIEEKVRKVARRCNNLSGKEWLRNSVSIWSNLRKNSEEVKLRHPASFPLALVKKAIDCFTSDEDTVILDPFVGIGTTVIMATREGKTGIGFDISGEYLSIAEKRLNQNDLFQSNNNYQLIEANAHDVCKYLEPNTVDLVFTSPPYWDILNRKRTADGKEIRNYGNSLSDLGNIEDYSLFLQSLTEVFRSVSLVLKPNKYCIVNVMDIRKGPKFFPVHSDLPLLFKNIDFELDDIIIWDRSHEYNNIRPLGYPSVFRINRIHEYLLVFKNRKVDDDSTN